MFSLIFTHDSCPSFTLVSNVGQVLIYIAKISENFEENALRSTTFPLVFQSFPKTCDLLYLENTGSNCNQRELGFT